MFNISFFSFSSDVFFKYLLTISSIVILITSIFNFPQIYLIFLLILYIFPHIPLCLSILLALIISSHFSHFSFLTSIFLFPLHLFHFFHFSPSILIPLITYLLNLSY